MWPVLPSVVVVIRFGGGGVRVSRGHDDCCTEYGGTVYRQHLVSVWLVVAG